MNRAWTLGIVAMAMAAGSVMIPQGAADRTSPGPTAAPVLENTCLITSDVKRLVDFYEPILHRKAKWSGGDYAEFATGAGTLAIFSADAQERYIPGSAQAANNKSVILEFKVTDVDAEYLRIKEQVKIWVKPPTTQPWGTRSIYFRDPDGNLVDFYTRVPAS
jgi:uncharacterized glyoxalase superfamily protein PhnB